MQGNDISVFDTARQASMFEGILASPPNKSPKYLTLRLRNSDTEEAWEQKLRLWLPGSTALKSLSDQVNRLGVITDIYTFLSPNAVEPISRWLIRKGVSVPVFYCKDVAEMAFDLSFNRSVQRIYTSNWDDAKVLGLRSTVVGTNTAWML